MKSPLITLILLSAVCVAAIVGYGFWYSFIEHTRASVISVDAQINERTQNATHIAYARAALTEITSDENMLQSYFVPESSVVTFINTMESRATTLGASVKVGSVSKTTVSGRPYLTFILSIKGSFDAVMRTVGSIESAPYDLVLSKLALGRDAGGSWHADATLLVGSAPQTTALSTP